MIWHDKSTAPKDGTIILTEVMVFGGQTTFVTVRWIKKAWRCPYGHRSDYDILRWTEIND